MRNIFRKAVILSICLLALFSCLKTKKAEILKKTITVSAFNSEIRDYLNGLWQSANPPVSNGWPIALTGQRGTVWEGLK